MQYIHIYVVSVKPIEMLKLKVKDTFIAFLIKSSYVTFMVLYRLQMAQYDAINMAYSTKHAL